MVMFPKLIYRFNIVPIKITASETDKLISKFIWKIKAPRRTKTILKKKKNKVGELKIPDFKDYCKATGIKTVSLKSTNLWSPYL